MSACAQTARQIVDMIQRRESAQRRDSHCSPMDEEEEDNTTSTMKSCTRDKTMDSVMKLLNHDGILLGQQRCNTLALLTVYEAIRVLLNGELDSDATRATLEFLETVEKELLSDRFGPPPVHMADHVHLLSLKHMGRGVEYLVMQQCLKKPTKPIVGFDK